MSVISVRPVEALVRAWTAVRRTVRDEPLRQVEGLAPAEDLGVPDVRSPRPLRPSVAQPGLGGHPSRCRDRNAPRGPAQRLSFEAVYDGNVDFVWRVISRLGVPPSAVPAVAQEVFVVAHTKLADLQGRSIQPWLFQIARLAVHHYRRTVGRWDPPRSEEGVSLADADAPRTEGNAPRADVASPQATLLLHGILAEMSDEEREVFVLAELEQLTVPDVAEAIGVNLSIAHSRLGPAREAFNRSIARHQGAIDGDDDSLSLVKDPSERGP